LDSTGEGSCQPLHPRSLDFTSIDMCALKLMSLLRPYEMDTNQKSWTKKLAQKLCRV